MKVFVIAAAAALALPCASAAAAGRATPGVIVCDQLGCRPETGAAAAPAGGAGARKSVRTADRSRRGERASRRPPNQESGVGIVRSKKTGATARVAARYAARFQAYVDALEAAGAAIYYMGGIRPGVCSVGSQHPCGSALDVCQDYRGHVSAARDCHLPRPAAMAAIARANGLHEGAVWCRRPDYGHAQVVPSGSECEARGTWGHGRPRRYLATITGRIKVSTR